MRRPARLPRHRLHSPARVSQHSSHGKIRRSGSFPHTTHGSCSGDFTVRFDIPTAWPRRPCELAMWVGRFGLPRRAALILARWSGDRGRRRSAALILPRVSEERVRPKFRFRAAAPSLRLLSSERRVERMAALILARCSEGRVRPFSRTRRRLRFGPAQGGEHGPSYPSDCNSTFCTSRCG